jgi:DNA-binding XRE family transcriptional regulator
VDSYQERLAQLVKQGRLAVGLSVRAAAKAAGVDRATWTAIEEGTRQTQDRFYVAIERTLRWPPNTMGQIVSGAITSLPQGLPLPGKPGSPSFKRAGYVAAMLDELADEWGEDVLQEAWQLRQSKHDGHVPGGT